jgi:hypothetical protein
VPSVFDASMRHLVRHLLVDGGVSVVTHLSDVAAECTARGLAAPEGEPTTIVVASVVQLDGVLVLRIARAVSAPAVLPVAWAVHAADLEKALAPLDHMEAWAKRFELWSRRAGHGAAALFTGGSVASALEAARSTARHAVIGWALLGVTSLAGALLAAFARAWLTRHILAVTSVSQLAPRARPG